MEVSDKLHALAALHPGKLLSLDRRLSGPERCGEHNPPSQELSYFEKYFIAYL
jgi:hypothetical protein